MTDAITEIAELDAAITAVLGSQHDMYDIVGIRNELIRRWGLNRWTLDASNAPDWLAILSDNRHAGGTR